jgi:hypothetical protein
VVVALTECGPCCHADDHRPFAHVAQLHDTPVRRCSDNSIGPDPDVVDTDLGEGEMALLNLRTRVYFSLNVTGADLAPLEARTQLGDISRPLQEEFERCGNGRGPESSTHLRTWCTTIVDSGSSLAE